jgi:hypothetical protein
MSRGNKVAALQQNGSATLHLQSPERPFESSATFSFFAYLADGSLG